MKRHAIEVNAAVAQRLHQGIGEMQPSGWRGHRSLLSRKHRLVVGAIPFVDRTAARDIGWQWRLATLDQRLIEYGAVEGKRQRHFATLPFGFDRGVKLLQETYPSLAAETHHVSDCEALRRLHQGKPARTVESLRERRRDRGFIVAAADAAAMQVCRKDLGIVDDKSIARPQQIRQIAYDAVFALTLNARAHNQEARGISRRCRPQRDAIFGQFEIE